MNCFAETTVVPTNWGQSSANPDKATISFRLRSLRACIHPSNPASPRRPTKITIKIPMAAELSGPGFRKKTRAGE